MACRAQNLTKEQVNNAMRNHGLLFPTLLNQTQEETNDRIRQLKEMMKKEEEVYYVSGIKVNKRVSEYAKRKLGLKKLSSTPDDDIKREGGVYIHQVMADLVDAIYNNKGNIYDIRKRTKSGDFKMSDYSFDYLVKQAKEVITQIEDVQKKIDPKGKATIHTEAFNVSAIKNMGGTMDVFAVFSDNTGAIYDYKTRTGDKKMGYTKEDKWGLVTDLLSYSDTKSYDLAMKTYKDLALSTLGVKSIRENRLVPILVDYTFKPKDQQEEGSVRIKSIERILTTEEASEFLSQLPVGGESTRFIGINKLLTNQLSQITKLQKKLDNKTLLKEDRDILVNRIRSIQKAIKNTVVKEDINDTLSDLHSTLLEVSNRLKQPKFNENNQVNPLYPTLSELEDFLSRIDTYSNILDNTNAYFDDLEHTNPELYKSTRKRLQEIVAPMHSIRLNVSLNIENMILESMPSNIKDEKGNLLPMSELDWLSLRTLHFSEIDHPLFKETWKLIQKQQYDIKEQFLEINNNIWDKTEKLFKWAKDNNMSRTDAFAMMINKDTGNLYSKLNPKFRSQISLAYTNKNIDSVKFLKSVYEFKNGESEYIKKYNERLEEQREKTKARFNNYEDIEDAEGNIVTSSESLRRSGEKAMNDWIRINDLIHSNEAWLNSYTTSNSLKLKDSVVKENFSDEYKRILANKPVLEYYEMWTNYMEKFAKMLNIHDWSVLPNTFIPNVRKEMLEYVAKDKLQLGASIREFMDSFNIREEDVYIGQVDEFTGEMKKEIPILFLNKLTDKDGKIANDRKSYDLSSSLSLFAKTALNYKYMSELEPKIQAMKMLMGTPTAEQGGTEITDQNNRKIKSKFQNFLTKDGLNTDTYETFEAFTDYYLYGIKYKEKATVGDFNLKKFILKTKNYNALTKLGFAIVPAGGAYLAGKIGTLTEAKKGISYSTSDMTNAVKLLATENKKYYAFAEFFDPYNDDYMDRTFRKLSMSGKRKILNERSMFYPLRKADEKIMQTILVAMSQNYGITKDGGIVRLNKPGTDASQYKSIWESAMVNDNGEIEINGLNEQGFIAFRNAVKSTSSRIIGNMNPEDVSMTDLSLTQNVLMQFKTWMPGVFRERVGKLRYDEDIQAMKWGRFKALANQFKRYDLTDTELAFGQKMWMFTKKSIIPETSKLILDITTFGLAPKLGMERVNVERAQRHFVQWQAEHPESIGKITFDDFLEIKQAQIKASIVELRIIFGFLSVLMFLGGKGDDDEARYYHNWATRNVYKIFTKTYSELIFMWSPAQLAQLMKNPIPMWSLLTLAQKTLQNGVDETRDLVMGENSPQDKSPGGYYMLQWMYGGPQLARFFEIYESYKKSPYAPGFVATNQ